MDFVALFPTDIVNEIFKLLGPLELTSAECASKSWAKIASQRKYWEKQYIQPINAKKWKFPILISSYYVEVVMENKFKVTESWKEIFNLFSIYMMKEGSLSDHCGQLLVFSLASLGSISSIFPFFLAKNIYLLKKLHLIRMLFFLERVLRYQEQIDDSVNFNRKIPVGHVIEFLTSTTTLTSPGEAAFNEILQNLRKLGDKQYEKQLKDAHSAMFSSGRYKSFETRIKSIQDLLIEWGVKISLANPRRQFEIIMESKSFESTLFECFSDFTSNRISIYNQIGILEMYEGKLQRILLDILFDVELQPSENEIRVTPISELLRKVCCFMNTTDRVIIWAYDQWANEGILQNDFDLENFLQSLLFTFDKSSIENSTVICFSAIYKKTATVLEYLKMELKRVIESEGNQFSQNQKLFSALILSNLLEKEELEILRPFTFTFPDNINPVIIQGLVELRIPLYGWYVLQTPGCVIWRIHKKLLEQNTKKLRFDLKKDYAPENKKSKEHSELVPKKYAKFYNLLKEMNIHLNRENEDSYTNDLTFSIFIPKNKNIQNHSEGKAKQQKGKWSYITITLSNYMPIGHISDIMSINYQPYYVNSESITWIRSGEVSKFLLKAFELAEIHLMDKNTAKYVPPEFQSDVFRVIFKDSY